MLRDLSDICGGGPLVNRQAFNASPVAMLPRATAAYASRPDISRGRLYREPASATRTEFQRDRDRIIHSAAFRRLAYKTQVFVYHEGDHYRTRLTHSLEVSQIARSIARVLGCDDDLAEALALAHDLGHTPFGHTGEDALDAAMADFGGFDHNAQSLRIVTRLERRYAGFDGLNLTWETLEGLAKHNGPLIGPHAGRGGLPPPHAIATVAGEIGIDLSTFASIEAQIAAIADDIAYNNHDIDDGVRAGLFAPDDLAEIPMIGDVLAAVAGDCGEIEAPRRVHEMMRRLITLMVEDVIGEARRRLARIAPGTPDAVRRAETAAVEFSGGIKPQMDRLRAFLFEHMYRHERVQVTRKRAADIVRALFAHYMEDATALPEEWRSGLVAQDPERRARRVADFIAGMTDRFAIECYETRFARPADFS